MSLAARPQTLKVIPISLSTSNVVRTIWCPPFLVQDFSDIRKGKESIGFKKFIASVTRMNQKSIPITLPMSMRRLCMKSSSTSVALENPAHP